MIYPLIILIVTLLLYRSHKIEKKINTIKQVIYPESLVNSRLEEL